MVAGTNGFIAAFVAGMAFGAIDRRDDEEDLRFTEEGGTLLSLLVWFMFGAVMLGPGLGDIGWRTVVFALLALTVVRMVPVAIALTGAASTGPPSASSGGSVPVAWPRWCSASSPSTRWHRHSPRWCWKRSR